MRCLLCAAGAVGVISTSTFAGLTSSFGTLTDGHGDEISFDAGTGNSNTNFRYNNYWSGDQSITAGLSVQSYYGDANGPVTNDGVDGFFVQAGPDQSGNPNALPGSPRWGFKWSVTVDGAAPNADDLFMSLRIDGPGGNWGFEAGSGLASGIAPVETVTQFSNQNVWTLGYDFFALNSADSGLTGGLWDGLDFDFNALGDYRVVLGLYDGDPLDGAAYLGETAITISVVPAPGALVAFAGLGFIGRRRRI